MRDFNYFDDDPSIVGALMMILLLLGACGFCQEDQHWHWREPGPDHYFSDSPAAACQPRPLRDISGSGP